MNSEKHSQHEEHGIFAMLFETVHRLSYLSATIGGLVLYGLALTVTVSVIMRAMNVGGITGDVEIVKMGCGFSAFLFLPLCQLRKGHVTVDLFSNMLPSGIQNFLEILWEFIFALCWLVLAWHMVLGGHEIYEYEDKTQLLEIPVWIVYAPAVFGSIMSAIVALLNSYGTFAHKKYLAARVG